MVTDELMIAIEKHLRMIGYGDTHKVQLATYLFRGGAKRWWETVRQKFMDRELSWAEFRELFNANYFPA